LLPLVRAARQGLNTFAAGTERLTELVPLEGVKLEKMHRLATFAASQGVSSIDSPGVVKLACDAGAEWVAANCDASLDTFKADRPSTELLQPGATGGVARPRTPPSPSEASTKAPIHSLLGSAPSSPCSSKDIIGDADSSNGGERAPCAPGPIADLRDIISWRKQGLLNDLEFAAAKSIALGLPM
jgi:hypothetical protein